ncbi:MAG: SUMF1/EgtB/PvdO family nonheme iron enzyme [Betaproteobacteria bacterium]
MTFADPICSAPKVLDVPTDKEGLRQALIAQREYTLALYADLPQSYWISRDFPQLATVNPPLWELAHVAWFQEFFALRWRADDVKGWRTPSCLADADALFDSAFVAHGARWNQDYPSRDACFNFMRWVLEGVLDALARSADAERYRFQLVLVHEDMHAEALAMTLTTLALPIPSCVPARKPMDCRVGEPREINFAGGEFVIGARERSFGFDNEKPAHPVHLSPFDIDVRVVSAAEFAAFATSAAYRNADFWSPGGLAWRDSNNSRSAQSMDVTQADDLAAIHVSFFEAEAYCRWTNRRLPTEAEWEYAAMSSTEFFVSTGHVWEWTASPFLPYAGFEAERYRDYSEPWFHSQFAPRLVLKGGSFVTQPRLKYPQYRNFYAPDRCDVFCGFRTCAIK